MEDLIESIRLAVVPDASDEARAAGSSACRTLLTALDPKPGEPGEPIPVPTPPAPAIDPASVATSVPAQLATAITMLRGVPVEQLLDLAIARLRAALPADQAATSVQPIKLQLVPVPASAWKTTR
ncbi:MAG: hypothetical protein WKG01_11465 [Kofleriaceae bacterium]